MLKTQIMKARFMKIVSIKQKFQQRRLKILQMQNEHPELEPFGLPMMPIQKKKLSKTKNDYAELEPLGFPNSK